MNGSSLTVKTAELVEMSSHSASFVLTEIINLNVILVGEMVK